MTTEKLHQIGFIVNRTTLTIEPITYVQFLEAFGDDSEFGWSIREEYSTEEDGSGTRHRVYGHKINRDAKYWGAEFADEVDAKMFIYDQMEKYLSENIEYVPVFHETMEEAQKELWDVYLEDCDNSDI